MSRGHWHNVSELFQTKLSLDICFVNSGLAVVLFRFFLILIPYIRLQRLYELLSASYDF